MIRLLTPTAGTRRSTRGARGTFARLAAGFTMLLYLGVAMAAPVADGLVDHGDNVVVHVEDAEGGHCPESHGPHACAVCHLTQGLRASLSPAAVALTVPVGGDAPMPTADELRAAGPTFLDGRSSRAPPLG